MPRPREFDEQDAVARATELFHRRGYHATSTRDLGEALALNPSSLYRAFGDKHALFLRALDHYQQCESARCAAALEVDRPVRAVLRDWLCAGFDAMTAAIADLLRRGTADGELPADLDADATADLLFTTATGLRVRHRAGHDARRLHAVVDQALRALG